MMIMIKVKQIVVIKKPMKQIRVIMIKIIMIIIVMIIVTIMNVLKEMIVIMKE